MKTKQIANQQVSELDTICRRCAPVTQKFASSIRSSARQAIQEGRKLGKLKPSESLLDEVTDLMVFSYLERVRKTRKIKRRSLGLSSTFEKDVKRAAQRFDLNLENLRGRLKPTANANLTKSLSNLQGIINSELSRSVQDGVTGQTAIRRVTGRLERAGATPSSPSYVETLVRTHAQIAYNAAHWNQFQGDPDLWGFEYVTAGDGRVRLEHERLDGMIRKKDDPIWQTVWPPNGWNCRCQVVAIYEKARQTPVPKSLDVDEEFLFNPGDLLAA